MIRTDKLDRKSRQKLRRLSKSSRQLGSFCFILSQNVVLFILLQHFKWYLLIMFPHTVTQLYLLTMSVHPQPTNKQTFRCRADSN